MMTTTACRSCGAPVIWASSAVTGKAIPLDAEPLAEPVPAALLLADGDVAWPVARAEHHKITGGTFHLSHFATCPQADNWRKR